ncbi:transcription factor DIVARICATA-like isoform X1 [Vigna unguiculata]|uniref:transcription factor DIVARICATA-like isoform X1 n=1 Tax=Vigna unguiculata TaxID=3917 RepID=UPI0010161E94|nr:transcription factor DIVARICATA-like isoform X1 [Vigna unguiculata]XP_027939353.1 transcription factor DIVARICATA-like isoform X1 [Vigna unguiculata]
MIFPRFCTNLKGMELETLYPPCFMPDSNWFVQESQSTEWSREDNKKFESALAIYDKDTPDRWFKVAAMIPGKTVFDVIKQYRELEEDVSEIEAGRVPIPGYLASSFTFELVHNHNYDGCRRRPAPVRGSDQERKKGVPWTEEEHRRFLMGLLKYGKGDWRNISRNFVVTKTPTQVASHAQKYYIRQKVSGGKDKRRPSIHDITTVNLTETAASDKIKSPLFNVSPMNSLSKVQLDWTSHCNDGSLMVFNPNSDNLFVSSSSDITSMALKMQGQDLYDCALHEAYAKVKAPGFGMAPRDFNNEAIFGIHAL